MKNCGEYFSHDSFLGNPPADELQSGARLPGKLEKRICNKYDAANWPEVEREFVREQNASYPVLRRCRSRRANESQGEKGTEANIDTK